jgi:hypothetical protein
LHEPADRGDGQHDRQRRAAFDPPITFTAVSGMPDSQAGVAAGVASTSRQIGQTLGVAIVGSILGTAAAGRTAGHLAAASHAAWWTVAACGAAVLAIDALSTGAWALRTARRSGERLTRESEAQGLVAA